MVREWPRLQAHTRAAMKKKKPLEVKVLAGVTNLVSEIREILGPVQGNSRLARNLSLEAQRTAHSASEVRTPVGCLNRVWRNVVFRDVLFDWRRRRI